MKKLQPVIVFPAQATESDLSSHQDFGNFISSQVVQVDDFGNDFWMCLLNFFII